MGELLVGRLRVRLGDDEAGVGVAVGDGEVDAVPLDVGDDDGRGVRRLAHGGHEQADGAGAEDEHRRPRRQAGAGAGAHRHRERLHDGAEVQGEAVGKPWAQSGRQQGEGGAAVQGGPGLLVAPPGRVVDGLLQRALGMGEDLGRAAEAEGAADVVSPAAAVLAALARQADLEGDAVAGREARDGRADGDDGAARLVAQRQRLAHAHVAIAEVVEVVQVGAAEARRPHRDLHLVGAGRRQRALLEPKVARPVQHRRLHAPRGHAGLDGGASVPPRAKRGSRLLRGREEKGARRGARAVPVPAGPGAAGAGQLVGREKASLPTCLRVELGPPRP